MLLATSAVFGDPPPQVRITPEAPRLVGPESSLQVLVTETLTDGRDVDRTADARYRVSDPGIATISERGLLASGTDGVADLLVEIDGVTHRVSVEVVRVKNPVPISFRNEVIPVLTKQGCNSGGCHGKAEGQNGFRLSIFGFDAEADHQALTMESGGRRVMVAAPEHSLLLRKGAGLLPHGGGAALEPASYGYRRLARWAREGAKLDTAGVAPITAIRVEPDERRLDLRGKQQLRVLASDADGNERDVTAEAEYETNAPAISEVDPAGLVRTGDVPGEAAILVRYLGHVDVCRVTIPRPGVEFPRPAERNVIDTLVWNKLEELGIEPSGPCDDPTFLRRVYLDTIGTLPTAAEARRFLDDDDPDKRLALIDELLGREEYATYWALRWADLVKLDVNALGPEPAYAMYRWLRLQFEQNRPYDAMVRDILTARGSTRAVGPAPLYLTLDEPKEIASATSQLFLGVRIECAECHHHPFERWSQADFTAYTGFFTGITKKKLPGTGEQAVLARIGRDLTHPRTGATVPAAGLGSVASSVDELSGDRRQALADWMTADDNPFFARAMANRLWAHYFGRGLVDPVDDLRDTNPASNEPLLGALATHLRDVDYDLKAFTRTILASRVYQASYQTTATNQDDQQNFSHAAHRLLPAEVLLDAICQATAVPEKFNGWPVGARAIEVWDNRMPSYFFRVFGRPGRTTVCACERGDDPSITQALHLMASPEIAAKLRHRDGIARKLAASGRSPAEIITELYLIALSRRPSDKELLLMLQAFDGDTRDRQAATEDVLWALLNTKEFLFVR